MLTLSSHLVPDVMVSLAAVALYWYVFLQLAEADVGVVRLLQMPHLTGFLQLA